MSEQQTDRITELEENCDRLERKMYEAATILDSAMGDTDVEGDDSPMFRAHVILITAAMRRREVEYAVELDEAERAEGTEIS